MTEPSPKLHPAIGSFHLWAKGESPEIALKIVGDSATGRALGAQAVGASGAAWRVNVIGMALEYGIALTDLTRLELAYCPAVSEVHDPLLRAVDLCTRRMKRGA